MCRGTTYFHRLTATSPQFTLASLGAPTGFRSVCCSEVLFPWHPLCGSHLPTLSLSDPPRYFSSSWHLCDYCSRVFPRCQVKNHFSFVISIIQNPNGHTPYITQGGFEYDPTTFHKRNEPAQRYEGAGRTLHPQI